MSDPETGSVSLTLNLLYAPLEPCRLLYKMSSKIPDVEKHAHTCVQIRIEGSFSCRGSVASELKPTFASEYHIRTTNHTTLRA